MKQITVLHVVGPTSGGIKEYVTSLVTNTDTTRFDLVVASSIPFLTNVEHIEHVHIDLRFRTIPTSIWRLCRVLTNRDVHVIHTHGLKANLAGVIAAKLSRQGHVIYTVHGGISFSEEQPIKAKLYAILERILTKYNARVITVSNLLRQELQKRAQRNDESTITIYTGIDEHRLEPKIDIETMRQSFHIPMNSNVIGTIARLAPQKGLCYLIKAMKQVIHSKPNTILVIAGDGPLRDELEDLASEEDVLSHIRFLGFVQDIGSLLELIHVFVLPSWTEGLPITILEALLAGKAVVATKVGGIPEVIENERNGLLVEPRNPDVLAAQILRLLDDDELRTRLGDTGRRIVKDRFSIEHMVAEYCSIYEEVVPSKRWIGDVEEQNV